MTDVVLKPGRGPGDSDKAVYVSVDVETAGAYPARYALLALGACFVAEPDRAFYVELQPDHPDADLHALEVSGLSFDQLAKTGAPPVTAMTAFAEWLAAGVPDGSFPLFVGFNAPFDWMYVNDYFHRYLGHNPFGHVALDIKSYYMGLKGVTWSETSLRHIAPRYLQGAPLSHNALDDARDQARLFRQLLAEAAQTQPSR